MKPRISLFVVVLVICSVDWRTAASAQDRQLSLAMAGAQGSERASGLTAGKAVTTELPPGLLHPMDSFSTGSKQSAGDVLPKGVADNQGPELDVWYASDDPDNPGPDLTLRFGDLGRVQQWCNVLGRVSDASGVESLTYSLNGGAEVALTIGPDGNRLENLGDFNADLDCDDLVEGTNILELRALDTQDPANETIQVVRVKYTSGNVWPLPYSVDWTAQPAGQSGIPDVAQVVDGNWAITTNGLNIVEPGWDRLVGIGDVTWTDYEVDVSFTVNASMGNNSAIGVLQRWQGHTDNPISGRQPKSGYLPLGGIGWYEHRDGMEIFPNDTETVGDPTVTLAPGTKYRLITQVQSNAEGAIYRVKVFAADGPEPAGWNVTHQEDLIDPQKGSMLLLAHQIDATFHDVAVTALPVSADATPPVLANIAAAPGIDRAYISWTTDEPVTSRVEFGETTSYELGSVSSNEWTTDHLMMIDGLRAGTEHHFRVISSDGNNNTASSPDRTFTTAASPVAGAVTDDDFNACSLDTELWTVLDPAGQSSVAVEGGGSGAAVVEIAIPDTVALDSWSASGNRATRIVQGTGPAVNEHEDFDVLAGFESPPSGLKNGQGILIEEDDDDWLRFDVFAVSDSEVDVFVGEVRQGRQIQLARRRMAAGDARALRVARRSSEWTLQVSPDAVTWTTVATVERSLAVSSVGLFAANPTGLAHTARSDFFLSSENGLSTEDSVLNTVSATIIGDGTVERSPTKSIYTCGEPVELTATPNAGWGFLEWGGDLSGSSSPISVVVEGPVAAKATFNNLAPVAENDFATVVEDSTNNALSVLDNDTDAGAEAQLVIVDVGTPDQGGAVATAADGRSLIYSPAPDFAGSEAFSYTISDQPGAESVATVEVTVTGVNDPPVLSNPGDQASVEGDDVSLVLNASDVDGDSLTFSASGLPGGLGIDPANGTISGTLAFDTASNSPYAIAVEVVDGNGGADSVGFTWRVADTNRAPEVTAPSNQSSTETESVSLAISASDPDGDTLTFSATNLPLGLSIDADTGVISGTISFAAASESPYSVDVAVTDGIQVVHALFSWLVADRQPLDTEELIFRDSFGQAASNIMKLLDDSAEVYGVDVVLTQNVVIPQGDAVTLMSGRDTAGQTVLELRMQRRSGGLGVMVRGRTDERSWVSSGWRQVTEDARLLSLEWTRSHSEHSIDGSLVLFVDGVPVTELLGLNNHSQGLHEAQITASGWHMLDETQWWHAR